MKIRKKRYHFYWLSGSRITPLRPAYVTIIQYGLGVDRFASKIVSEIKFAARQNSAINQATDQVLGLPNKLVAS